MQLVGGLPLLQQVGVLDSTGTLTSNLVVPDPPTGVQGLALQRQAWVLPADGAPPILTQPLAFAWVAAGL
ncbi:MAG TPA: hypothetical protein VMT18_07835 [Planctomycetota bacterium]|nr:hypothetical protein [Planctomycetota bacterium]